MQALQNKIPQELFSLENQDLIRRIDEARKTLGDKVTILGHHYQQDDVIRFADFTGDSYELSKIAAAQTAEHVIFCGVHFMAESADVLTAANQKVYLPDLRAGCTMADMAKDEDVETAWEELMEILSPDEICPITYMNSTAFLKAFCADNDGTVCTSSNAEQVIRWGFDRAEKLLFFPDQHLGRNVCFHSLGIPLDKMLLWNPAEYLGGHSPEAIKEAKVILWQGHCSVHMGFQKMHVDYWRNKDPEVKVLVHPECRFDVVSAADMWGSTGMIIKTIKNAPAGSKWAIGTEINLVNRLKEDFPEQFITSLSPYQCLCATMYRIKPQFLLYTLESLIRGEEINRISVSEKVSTAAKKALNTMIEITRQQTLH